MAETVLRLHTIRCLGCEHPISAVSERAIVDTLQTHVDYVNAIVDRATDPHFIEHRLDALIAV